MERLPLCTSKIVNSNKHPWSNCLARANATSRRRPTGVPWEARDVYAAMFKDAAKRILRVVKIGGDVTAAERPIKRAVAQIPGRFVLLHYGAPGLRKNALRFQLFGIVFKLSMSVRKRISEDLVSVSTFSFSVVCSVRSWRLSSSCFLNPRKFFFTVFHLKLFWRPVLLWRGARFLPTGPGRYLNILRVLNLVVKIGKAVVG